MVAALKGRSRPQVRAPLRLMAVGLHVCSCARWLQQCRVGWMSPSSSAMPSTTIGKGPRRQGNSSSNNQGSLIMPWSALRLIVPVTL